MKNVFDGTCDGAPSEVESGACRCKKPFGYEGMPVWSYNCCPLGFRVTDLDAFNALPQAIDPNNPSGLAINLYLCRHHMMLVDLRMKSF